MAKLKDTTITGGLTVTGTVKADSPVEFKDLTTKKYVDDAIFNVSEQTTANLVTAWGANPANNTYPSSKLVKDTIDDLVMGTVTTIDGGTI